jgi:hypothetical protein
MKLQFGLLLSSMVLFFAGSAYAAETLSQVAVDNDTMTPYYVILDSISGLNATSTAIILPSNLGQGGTINVPGSTDAPPNGTVTAKYYISPTPSSAQQIGICTFQITFTPINSSESHVSMITQDCKTTNPSVEASLYPNATPPMISIND